MKRYAVHSSTIAALLMATLSLTLGACGDDDDDGDDDDVPTIDAGGQQTYTHYVNDAIKAPQNNQETRDYALNIDGDAQNRPDNALGGILSALKTNGVDIQTSVTDSINSGDLVLLHSVKAKSLTADAAATWQVYLGTALGSEPKFDGTDTFTIDPQSPDDGILNGAITAGEFNGGPGDVTIQLALTTGAPIKVKLVGTRIKATVKADGCSDGVLGGGITKEELDGSVIPGIVTLMNNSIKDDGANGPLACETNNDPVCVPNPAGKATSCDTVRKVCVSSTSKTILGLFDANNNVEITEEEVKNAVIIKALLAPDVDLLNASGAFEPGVDGKKDSLSVGIGFTCSKAIFEAANE
jgi:hypothetical protein